MHQNRNHSCHLVWGKGQFLGLDTLRFVKAKAVLCRGSINSGRRCYKLKSTVTDTTVLKNGRKIEVLYYCSENTIKNSQHCDNTINQARCFGCKTSSGQSRTVGIGRVWSVFAFDLSRVFLQGATMPLYPRIF